MPLGTSWRAKVSPSTTMRVAGVVAALVADDQLHLLGQEVGELALALVTPLGPDDDGCRHASSPPLRMRITHQCTPRDRGRSVGRTDLRPVAPAP